MVKIIIKKCTRVQFNNIRKFQKALGIRSVELLIPLKEHHLQYEPLCFVILRFETVEHYNYFPIVYKHKKSKDI